MAASFIRSVNVGQDDPDTKERLSRISFRILAPNGRIPLLGTRPQTQALPVPGYFIINSKNMCLVGTGGKPS
ncbi:MAG: hypothetical protein IKH01_00380 [Prevotella sp.]|nr:hypothetical protein [Prevotella sp.]